VSALGRAYADSLAEFEDEDEREQLAAERYAELYEAELAALLKDGMARWLAEVRAAQYADRYCRG
jgi:hypothetical protein